MTATDFSFNDDTESII